MRPSSFFRGMGRIVSGILGIIAFLVFVHSAYLDRMPIASSAAALSLALLILAILDLDTFEVFGIKAKLKDTLVDAEDKLNSLREVMKALATSAFFQIARGKLKHEERRKIIDDITKSLENFGLNKGEIFLSKSPFFEFIALEFWYRFHLIVSNYRSNHINSLQERVNILQNGLERLNLEQKIEIFSEPIEYEYPTVNNFSQIRYLLARVAQATPVTCEKDRSTLQLIAAELSTEFESFLERGNYDDSSISIIRELKKSASPLIKFHLSRLNVQLKDVRRIKLN